MSNYGEPWVEDNLNLLGDLVEKNLVDEIVGYAPDLSSTPHFNELAKRNIGLNSCRMNNCSHILMMDADELYIYSQLSFSKILIEEKGIDHSACRMFTYFKEPVYRISPPEKYFVPFISKIYDNSSYVLHSPYPVLVDPTRRLSGPYTNFHKFEMNDVAMHHYSFVRKDIRRKIMNSSAKCNIGNPEHYVALFNDWKPGQKNFHPANPKEFRDVEIVDNIFDIDINRPRHILHHNHNPS
jgi:hypothetical protein